jgi:large subunit ribosomal protein L18
MKANYKVTKRLRRHARIRSKVMGTESRPRLSVFRSNAHIYAQVIDDIRGITLASASDIKGMTGTKAERSVQVGTLVAEQAKKAGISSVVFDRGGFQFTGRIKALAEAARSAGLSF